MRSRQPYRKRPVGAPTSLADWRSKHTRGGIKTRTVFFIAFASTVLVGVGLSQTGLGAWAINGAVAGEAGECILSVHDGDGIRLCSGERIRIANIDAPEMSGSPKCEDRRRSYAWCDFALGVRSRDALRAFVRTGPVALQRQGADRYGRTLANVSVNGKDAGSHLIGLGLAKPWR